MKRWVRCLVASVFAMTVPCSGWACAPEPPAAYDAPTYVDPGFESMSEEPWNNFNILIKDYTPAAGDTKTTAYEDSEAYAIEHREDEYRKTVTYLLKSKNIDPAALGVQKTDWSYTNERGGCVSNNSENALAFIRAAFADPDVKEGYGEFAKIRQDIRNLCTYQSSYNFTGAGHNEGQRPILEAEIAALKTKKTAELYAAYLEALVSFYYSDKEHPADFAQALGQFEALEKAAPQGRWWNKYLGKKPETTWLHQTALYMTGRVHLIMSQKQWDGYSAPREKVDAAELRKAKDSFASYIAAYPTGLYADSARNFSRKIMFLEGDQDNLNKALRDIANQALVSGFPTTGDDIVFSKLREFSHFYHGKVNAADDAPLLVAYEILNPHIEVSAETLPQLQSRKKDFDAYPGLLRFLQAYLLYRQQDYQKLIDLTPEEPLTTSEAALSTEAMRARAFENLGQKENAYKAWFNIATVAKDDQSQLHVAAYDVEHKNFVHLFGQESGLTNVHIAADFAVFGVPNGELWNVLETADMSAEMRKTVEQALFQKLLLIRDYAGMEKLYEKTSDAGAYGTIAEAVQKLAHMPDDAAAHMSIAKFLVAHYINPNSSSYREYNPFEVLDAVDSLKPLCPSCEDVKQAVNPASDFLRAEEIMAKSGASSDAEAEDLHRLIMCFHGSEDHGRCQWNQPDITNDSKEWFFRLHKKYPHSSWTEKTPYYY